MADPIEAGEEIAEAEPPARTRGREQPAQEAAGCTIDKPDQDGKGNERQRPNIGRRKRKRRGRPSEKRNDTTPPSPGQYDGLREAPERHGWWADLEGSVSEERVASSPLIGNEEEDVLGGGGGGPPSRVEPWPLLFCLLRPLS